jgi:hypothetical protein
MSVFWVEEPLELLEPELDPELELKLGLKLLKLLNPGSNAKTTFENWPLNSSSKKRISLNIVATSRVGFLKIGPQPYAPKQMS